MTPQELFLKKFLHQACGVCSSVAVAEYPFWGYMGKIPNFPIFGILVIFGVFGGSAHFPHFHHFPGNPHFLHFPGFGHFPGNPHFWHFWVFGENVENRKIATVVENSENMCFLCFCGNR
jgi:hypothetical protein